MNISRRAIPPVLIALVAAIALAILTGDTSYLLIILLGIVQSGGVMATAPAPGLTQEDVAALAAIKAPGPTPGITDQTAMHASSTVDTVARARRRA